MNDSLGDPGAMNTLQRAGLRDSMTLDRARLLAFLASGAVWIAGVSLGLRTGAVLALIAAGYVLVGSLALALAGGRTARMSAILWACAVVLWSAVLFPFGGLWATAVGFVIGTLCFGAWMGAGFMLLQFFTSRGAPPDSERPLR